MCNTSIPPSLFIGLARLRICSASQLGRVLSLKKTHLYGAANKNTSDGQNPAEKEDDELDCSSLLLRL